MNPTGRTLRRFPTIMRDIFLGPTLDDEMAQTPPFVESRTGETDVEYGMPPALTVPPTNPPSQSKKTALFVADMLRAGSDAASTPNVAYGGPTDIFRGMSNAGQMARQRELQDTAQSQARAKMQADLSMIPMRQREIAAKIKADEAQAGYYDARAKAESEPQVKPRFINTKDGLWDTEGNKFVTPPGEPTVKVPANVARRLGLVVREGQEETDVPQSLLERGQPYINEKPAPNPPNPTAASLARDAANGVPGAKEALDILNQGRRRGGEGGPRPRQMTPTQAGSIERRKNDALKKAKETFESGVKALKTGSNPLLGGLMGGKSNAPQFASEEEAYNWWNSENQRIQDAYENEIEAATGQPVTPFVYPKKGPASAAPQEETREYMGATYRKDKKTGQWVRQ